MRGGVRIGQVFGIEIRIDWSWLLIFFLIAFNLGAAYSQVHPNWGGGLTLVIGMFAALLFFVSVLLHELAHSLVAVSQGVPVRSITLFLFGGVSNIQREPPSPRAEFLITIVGPLTSLVLGVVLSGIAGVSARLLETLTGSAGVLASLDPLTTILLWLGSVNILLAIFNLIPGFPLDGGRVLRSILWAATHNLRQATRWASWVGQIIAWLFILAGFLMIFGVSVPFFGEGFINGLWLAFIGWFLNSAAIQSYEQVVIRDVLQNVPVSRLMRLNPPTVPVNIPVSTLVHDHLMQADDQGFPVMDANHLVGIVTVDDVRSVPRDRWDQTSVRDIMTPVQELVTTTPDEEVADALNKLTERDVRQLPVMRDGQLTGLLRRQDILRWLQLHGDGLDHTARSTLRKGDPPDAASSQVS
jgi:Zn-dependent protease